MELILEKSGSGCRFSIVLVCLCFSLTSTLSHDQEAIQKGESITFGCAKKEGKLQRWTENEKVVGDSKLGLEKAQMDKTLTIGSTEWFNLTLLSAKMEDRGYFVCEESEGATEGTTWLPQTSYNLTVLEPPVCGNLTLLSVDSGEILSFFCFSEIPGVTLLWHVGKYGERSVGEKAEDNLDRYNTSVKLKASPSIDNKSVYCELQHPSWHVLDGIIDCKVGPIAVRHSQFQIHCQLSSSASSSAFVSCSIVSMSPSQKPLSTETVLWEGSYDGQVFEPLELRQELRQTKNGSWESTASLDGHMIKSLTAVRIQAGFAIGDPIDLRPFRPSTSHMPVVIVMLVFVVLACVIFLAVLILYRQGRIFKPHIQASEVEMDKRALTQRKLSENQGETQDDPDGDAVLNRSLDPDGDAVLKRFLDPDGDAVLNRFLDETVDAAAQRGRFPNDKSAEDGVEKS